MMLVVEVAWVIGDDTLLEIVSWEVVDTESLLQAQLWREKHWWGITPEKKLPDIAYHSNRYLHNAMKMIVKMQSLSPQEKQDLMKRIQNASR
jgi:hypothetical protein